MSSHQRTLWWVSLVLVVFLLIGGLFLVRGVGQDVASFRNAGKRDRIAGAPTPEEQQLGVPRPSRKSDEDQAGNGDSADPDDPIEYNWHSPPRLRKAAAALARQGDLESAIALLTQAASDDASVRAVAETALGSLRFHFGPVVEKELSDLREFWLGLDAKERDCHVGESDE